jgi:cobalt-zinc-cadmium efflux system protein
MGHDHDHGHSHAVTNVNAAFVTGILLNTLFVILEFLVGYLQSSLALMTDAGHNATDVISLLLSLFAFRLLRVKATEEYSYGYKKASILISLFNAILLILVVGVIFYEGVRRLYQPVQLPGLTISLVALAGVAVNGISAYLFTRQKDHDINIKGAYLHLLADALVSLAVVVGGVLIWLTGFGWIDTALSFIVGIVILKSTWSLLNDSIRMALDGTPKNIDVGRVREIILRYEEVVDVHHIHIWAISSRQNAMTAHLVLEDRNLSHFSAVKQRIKHDLEHAGIDHVTFEVELKECEEGCGSL